MRPAVVGKLNERRILRLLQTRGPLSRAEVARESLDIYAPLANRIGVWHLKWELEDLSFRFLEPDTYKRIAKKLDERRVEREQFIDEAITRMKAELAAAGTPVGDADLAIAATAVWLDYRVATCDLRSFPRIKGLDLVRW